MIKVNTYTAKGTKVSDTSLPKGMESPVNMALLSQAIRVYQDRKHPGLSKAKTRGEVKTSTRKIYRQKGTGRARHGARSAPLFVGGGKAHGPKGLKRVLTLPRKMRRKALSAAVSIKAKEGEILVIDKISTLKKTKEAALLIEKIIKSRKLKKKNPKITFWLSQKNKNAGLFLRNIKNVKVRQISTLNVYDIYFGGLLMLDKDAVSEIGKLPKKSKKEVKK